MPATSHGTNTAPVEADMGMFEQATEGTTKHKAAAPRTLSEFTGNGFPQPAPVPQLALIPRNTYSYSVCLGYLDPRVVAQRPAPTNFAATLPAKRPNLASSIQDVFGATQHHNGRNSRSHDMQGFLTITNDRFPRNRNRLLGSNIRLVF